MHISLSKKKKLMIIKSSNILNNTIPNIFVNTCAQVLYVYSGNFTDLINKVETR